MTLDEALKILSEHVDRKDGLSDLAVTNDVLALKIYLEEQLRLLEERLKT